MDALYFSILSISRMPKSYLDYVDYFASMPSTYKGVNFDHDWELSQLQIIPSISKGALS